MGNYEFRKTDTRKEIFKRAKDIVQPLISYTSQAKTIDESVRLGTKYVERMRDKKKEMQEIDEKIKELQKQKQQIKDRWETEEISFSDV